jgi:hypothetical protein
MKRRITADARGKIKTGMKGQSKTGKEIPKSLDYFNIEAFPELVTVYGDKPTRLLIYCPANNIEDFYYSEYNAYGGGDKAIKKRSCDGEVCVHRITESINGDTWEAGEESECICKNLPENHKDRCKSYTGLKMFVADYQSGKIISAVPYYFETRSDNSSDNIYSELEKTFSLTGGRLIGIPFIISVKMIDSVKNGGKTKFPIWSLQAVGTVDHQLELASTGMIPTTDERALPVNILDESRMLETGSESSEITEELITKEEWETVENAVMEAQLPKGGLAKIIGAYGYSKGGEIKKKDLESIIGEIKDFANVVDKF